MGSSPALGDKSTSWGTWAQEIGSGWLWGLPGHGSDPCSELTMGLGQVIQAFGLSCPLCEVGPGLLGGPEVQPVPGRGRQPGELLTPQGEAHGLLSVQGKSQNAGPSPTPLAFDR